MCFSHTFDKIKLVRFFRKSEEANMGTKKGEKIWHVEQGDGLGDVIVFEDKDKEPQPLQIH